MILFMAKLAHDPWDQTEIVGGGHALYHQLLSGFGSIPKGFFFVVSEIEAPPIGQKHVFFWVIRSSSSISPHLISALTRFPVPAVK